jgi:phage FluMu gp28-like protein
MTAPALQLYDYQRRWFLDRARFKIGMFARQTGKTFTTTLEIVDSCIAAAAAGGRERWVILSRGERQAKEAMDEGVKRHAAAYGAAFQAMDYDWVGEQTRVKALEVELPNGSRITALPANPDTARGFSANVFLDEFAFHQDSHAIWKALFPVISAGWRLRITSTPNGKGNKFYELVTGRDATWSRHLVDIHRAVADGLPRDVAQLRAAINDDDAWAQEFELQFLDEATAWLPFELIASVEHEDAGLPEGYAGGRCYVGVDIGRRRDLFVIWVLEQVGDVLWTREVIAEKGASFAKQDALLDEVFRRYRVVRCAMDQTGMGEKPVEDAQRRYGTSRVEGVLMNPATQLRLATAGKEAMQDRRTRIPAGRPEIRADLHKLRKEVGATGAPRFVADRDGTGHADRAWAFLLAHGAADRLAVPMEFLSAGPRPAAAMRADFHAGMGG